MISIVFDICGFCTENSRNLILSEKLAKHFIELRENAEKLNQEVDFLHVEASSDSDDDQSS